MQKEKIAAQEDPNSLKKENNNIKDKENTLLEIFGMMKKFVNIDNTTSETIAASAADCSKAAPTPHSYSCRKSNHKAPSMDLLNNHIREEHITTKYPCLDCDFQALSMAGLRSHQESHNIHRNGARAKVCIKCDGCPYTTSSENNLEVHRSMEHSLVVKCKLCEKKYRTESELLVHEELDHNKTIFGCTDCSRIFLSSKRLQDHMQYQHSIVSHCQCDYCGQKFENWTELDAHIASEHKFSQNEKSNKDMDICDLSNRKPCNPASQ